MNISSAIILRIFKACLVAAAYSCLAQWHCFAAKFVSVKEAADNFAAEKISGKKFSIKLPEETAVSVTVVDFKASAEERVGKEVTIPVDTTLMLTAKTPNKWNVDAGEYNVPLRKCLVLVQILEELLAMYSIDCMRKTTCELPGGAAITNAKQQAACSATAMELFSTHIYKKLSTIVAKKIRLNSNEGLMPQAVYAVIRPRLKDWIEWQYFNKPTDDSEEFRSWIIESAQLVIMTKDRKGFAQKHLAVKLSTSAKDKAGNAVDIMAHMGDEKGERITGYDPRVYGTVLANVGVALMDGKKPTFGSLFDCVNGQGLKMGTGLCALYANRIIQYLTGSLRDCVALTKLMKVDKYKEKALESVVVAKAEELEAIDMGGVSITLLNALRGAP